MADSRSPTVASSVSQEKPSEKSNDQAQVKHGKPMEVKVRQEIVRLAAKFLNNDKVRGSSLEISKSFLRRKGLTNAEIDLAVAEARRVNPGLGMEIVPAAAPGFAVAPPLPARPGLIVQERSWRDYTLAAVIIAGVSYVLVVFVKKYILSWFWKREEEMDRKLNVLKETLDQTREDLTQAALSIKTAADSMQEIAKEQQQFIAAQASKDIEHDGNRRVLEEVKSDVVAVKGLILGRNQFPSPPTVGGIPSWQKAATATLSPSSPFEKVELDEESPTGLEGQASTGLDPQNGDVEKDKQLGHDPQNHKFEAD